MKVEKWRDDLAVRLPDSVVEALELEEGSFVELHIADERQLEISRDKKREAALATIRGLRRPLPEGFKFDRIEANEGDRWRNFLSDEK